MGYKTSLRAFVLATSLSAVLCASSTTFTIASVPLKEAIEKISDQSGLPYLVDAKLLEKKGNAPAISNVEGVQEALNAVLKKSGLKATIKNGTIMIEERKENEPTELEGISIHESSITTEGTGSYTTGSTNTATKLDLSLRDTPQTVVVYTRQKLDDQHITSTQELVSKIPGISLKRWDERLDVTARGFDVNYYLYDGIPTLLYSAGDDPDLIIYDRVEIVKGANGLMTGAGNPAMGMNFIRKHANSQELTGSVDTSVGSWDNYTASLDVQSPLNADGTIRARFVAKHQDSKSFLDFYEKNNDLFYGVVDMDLTDTTYLSLGASYENTQRDGTRWGGLPAFYTDGTRTNFSRSTNVAADWTYWDNKTITYFADFKQYLYKDIALNVAYSNRQINLDMVGAYFWGNIDKATGIGDGGTTIGAWKTKDEENNLDVYVSIPFELGKRDHELITGVSYNKDENKKNGWISTDILSSIANPTINFNHISLVNPYLQLETAPNGETIQKAYYLAGRFSLMEDLKFITGLRVSSYESDTSNYDRNFENELVPYAGLVYDIDQYHSVYVSYTSIFQPQYAWDANDNFLDPINGKSYEVGIKGEYFDGNLNTVLSVFRIEQDGVGESTGQINSNGNYISVAKEGVVSKGFEFGASGKITDNVSLDFGLANFEAKDANGDKFTTTNSRTTANVWTKYAIHNYRVGAGLNYKSKFYSGTGATQITQDAFVTTDLMAGYKASKNLDFQLNLNNIFDEKYYEGLSDANNLLYGAPRSVTLGMKYSF